jgi:hypothetical protein
VLLVASASAVLLVAAMWITTQFRTLHASRMSISQHAQGSTTTHHMVMAAPPALIVEHVIARLMYRTPVPHAFQPQRPQTVFATMPPNHPGWKNRPPSNRLSLLGFGINTEHTSVPWTGPENIQSRVDARTTITLPWWLLLALTGWPALLWLAHRLRTRPARREARGLCRRCAYDLRGIDSDVCPECATPRPSQKPPL